MPISTPPQYLKRYRRDRDHFLGVAERLFRPAANASGYQFIPPSVSNGEVIHAEIIKALVHADLVLCDITCWNANVFFELGMRVALDKPVAMVRDTLCDSIPFDNSLVSSHVYDPSLDPAVLPKEIARLAAFLGQTGRQVRNALWKHFGISSRERYFTALTNEISHLAREHVANLLNCQFSYVQLTNERIAIVFTGDLGRIPMRQLLTEIASLDPPMRQILILSLRGDTLSAGYQYKLDDLQAVPVYPAG